MAFVDSNAKVGVKRMGQVRHMKTIFRSGLNVASGAIPAGTKVRIITRFGGRR